MKHQIFCSVIIFLLCACNSNREAENSARQAANVAVVDKFRVAFEKSDFDTVDSLLADNYMGYGPSISDSITKAEALVHLKNEKSELYQSINYTFSESHPITIKTGAAAGDW